MTRHLKIGLCLLALAAIAVIIGARYVVGIISQDSYGVKITPIPKSVYLDGQQVELYEGAFFLPIENGTRNLKIEFENGKKLNLLLFRKKSDQESSFIISPDQIKSYGLAYKKL